MKNVQIELPEKIAKEVDRVVQAGWFGSTDELVRVALADYLASHRHELIEEFQREDIAWAVAQKQTP